MACINPDGTLTPAAQAVITALHIPRAPADIAQAANLPIYRVRSTLRELYEAGLVLELDGIYRRTENGQKSAQGKTSYGNFQ